MCVCVPGSAILNSSSRLSVSLRALCCIQINHLELRQVTAAAARLLSNHHLQGTKKIKKMEMSGERADWRANHRSRRHTPASADGDPAANPQTAAKQRMLKLLTPQ